MAKERNVDIVFCFDGTGSMAPCLDNVKANARRFHQDLLQELTFQGDTITSLRVKVITFRDYKDEGADGTAMEQSEFFELPGDVDLFDSYMEGVTHFGGGDYEENGLEALFTAMRSDFMATSKNDRQVIVLFTDAEALPLQERAAYTGYPTEMPKDLDEFISVWSNVQGSPYSTKLNPRSKRMVLFAPAGTVYENLSATCDNTSFMAVDPGTGMEGLDFNAIVKIVAASIGGK
ncbi:MAG: VWA domain-containing protein [Clostridia bacterium]|nr:VWA domain-containing protein [Clostridia bacterium]